MGNEGEITASSKPARTTYTGYVGAQTGFTNFERIGQRNDNAFIFGGEIEHTLAEDYLGEKSTIKGSVDCAVGSNLRAKTALSYNYLGRNGLKATAGLSVEYLKESKPSLFTSTGPENTGNCYYQYEINVPVPDGCTAYKTLNYTDDSHNSFWLPNNYPFEAVHDSVSFRKEYNIDIPPTSQETKFKAGRFSTELNVGLGYVEPKKNKYEIEGGFLFGYTKDFTPNLQHTYEGTVEKDLHIQKDLRYYFSLNRVLILSIK